MKFHILFSLCFPTLLLFSPFSEYILTVYLQNSKNVIWEHDITNYIHRRSKTKSKIQKKTLRLTAIEDKVHIKTSKMKIVDFICTLTTYEQHTKHCYVLHIHKKNVTTKHMVLYLRKIVIFIFTKVLVVSYHSAATDCTPTFSLRSRLQLYTLRSNGIFEYGRRFKKFSYYFCFYLFSVEDDIYLYQNIKFCSIKKKETCDFCKVFIVL